MIQAHLGLDRFMSHLYVENMANKIKSATIYLNYKHLSVSTDENKVVYLGYKFNATKTEYTLLQILIENTTNPLSAERIEELSEMMISKDSVAFHVSNINNKAKPVGNRPLIKNIAKNGYFLNEEM